MTPIAVKCKQIQFRSGTYHSSLFLTAAIISGQLNVYLIFLHTAHMCKYGSTSQFNHLLGFFKSSGHSLVGVDVGHIRNSDCHGSSIVNIMIVVLSCSVLVHTNVKGERVSTNA